MNTAGRPDTAGAARPDSPAADAPSPNDNHGAEDPDARKGAVEGDRPGDRPQQGNANLPALDAEGRPADWKKICEDAIGANADESTG